MNNKFVVIDLETTGNSPKKGDKIIQFAAFVVENGKMIEKFSSLVNPKMKIPLFIEELTGINDEMVKDAPFFEELAPKIQILLEDAYFVAHNVLFDLSFLQEELIMADQEGFFGPVIDTVELARFLYPTYDSYKLNDLALQMGFQHDRPHQADSDAEVTAKLLLNFLDRLESLPNITCKQLAELSGGLKSDIQLLFEDLIDNKAQKWEELPENVEVINGLVLQKVDENIELNGLKAENHSFPASDIDKEKQLNQAFSNFQKRIGQFHMMNDVYTSFSTQQHLVIEAGTGIGKSIGYLLPAAYFTKNTGNRVVVSTFTTMLQSQLIVNDIPLLEKILPFKIKSALLKGKEHYISLSKFEESLHELEDNYDSCLTKMQILIWLMETGTGDVDELNLSSGGRIFWNRIRHGRHTRNENQIWLEKDFYVRAKNKVNQADIIITNHSMLLSDYANSNQSLQGIDYVILDEGHHFHKVALKYFGAQLDYFKIRLLLNQFGMLEQKQLVYKLINWLKKNKINSIPFDQINTLLIDLFFEMDEFFKTIRIYVKSVSKMDHTSKINQKMNPGHPSFKMLLHSAERFSFLVKDFIDKIQMGCSFMESIGLLNGVDQRLYDELTQCKEELMEIRENIKRIFLNPSEKNVSWIEIDFRSYQNATTVYQQPVSVSKPLQEKFFTDKKSVIITSATLSIDNQFDYILNELGLDSLTKTKSIPSPFDYRSKVKFFVPKDLPEIKKVNMDDYVAAITEQIISIAEVTKGRMLILFTSHEMLRKAFTLMKESGLLEEYVLIAQGITGGSRSRLTRNFQKFDKAILFGTSSFWEGIDIPGEDLSCLIMVRLPFTPLDDPYLQAKCDEIKSHGGNSFLEVSLPEAVLRFKQGFGRLIRTDCDKGVLIVFDRRIITTKYGNAFTNAIPDVPVKEKKLEEILQMIRTWL
jgi:ATP-dependent DNA helicase DinG